MATDEFTKLFKYMSHRFNSIDKSLESTAKRDDIERIIGLLDSFAKRVEISDDERIVMGHQLDRLDRWTHELAQKIGHELAV